MKPKVILAGESAVFATLYNPFTSIVTWKEEANRMRTAFWEVERPIRNAELIAAGKSPKVNTVVEEATVVETAAVSQPVIEAIPVEQPIAVPTTPPPSTTTAEVPKRKLTLKLKETAATPVQRAKPKLVLKTQPSQ